MATPWLDKYRGDICSMLAQGMPQVRIREELRDKYGVDIPRSTLSDYLKGLENGNGGMTALELPTPEEARGIAVERLIEELGAQFHNAMGKELVERMAQLLESVEQAEQKSEARHAALVKAVDAVKPAQAEQALMKYSREFEKLYDALKGAALMKVWIRASICTGPFWAAAGALAYVWFWA